MATAGHRPSSSGQPNIRVIVRLPYNRPTEGHKNPPLVEWNTEKERILWEEIARRRFKDSAVPDWQKLAERLGVPLPYILYRAEVRCKEDLRDLRGALSPINTQPMPPPLSPVRDKERPGLPRRISTPSGEATITSSRLMTPLAVRARLNSLGYDIGTRHSKASSSSVLTLQAVKKIPSSSSPLMSPISNDDHGSSESDSEEERQRKEDDEERRIELDQKLKHLQEIMTNDAIGIVRSARPKAKEKGMDRSHTGVTSPTSPSPLRRGIGRRDFSSLSASENSAAGSPHGSIPSIPSPPSESSPQSPVARHMHGARKSSSPPTLSTGHVRGQSHMPYRPNIVGTQASSDRSSTQGSTASSFSDLSETSLSQSALASALSSNFPGTGTGMSSRM